MDIGITGARGAGRRASWVVRATAVEQAPPAARIETRRCTPSTPAPRTASPRRRIHATSSGLQRAMFVRRGTPGMISVSIDWSSSESSRSVTIGRPGESLQYAAVDRRDRRAVRPLAVARGVPRLAELGRTGRTGRKRPIGPHRWRLPRRCPPAWATPAPRRRGNRQLIRARAQNASSGPAGPSSSTRIRCDPQKTIWTRPSSGPPPRPN